MPGNVQQALQNIVHPLSLRCDIIITVCVAAGVDEQVSANGLVSLKSSASIFVCLRLLRRRHRRCGSVRRSLTFFFNKVIIQARSDHHP